MKVNDYYMAMDSNLIDTIWKVAGLIFAAGAVWSELKAIRKDIARLEAKQDKYNNLQERTRVLEVKVQGIEEIKK